MVCSTTDGKSLWIKQRSGNAETNGISDHLDVRRYTPASLDRLFEWWLLPWSAAFAGRLCGCSHCEIQLGCAKSSIYALNRELMQ